MATVRPHLKVCQYGEIVVGQTRQVCKDEPVFDVTMRHGAEWPACARHVAQVMAEAFRHDGDHGHVNVYEIGVAEETVEYERAKL